MTKKSPLIGIHREKLILALQAADIVADINQAMRVRKAAFELDYSEDQLARLYVSRPGVKREPLLTLNPAKKISYTHDLVHPDLHALTTDIAMRLDKYSARMILVSGQTRTGGRRAVLQIVTPDLRHIGMSLMEVRRHHCIRETAFQLPDGTTP